MHSLQQLATLAQLSPSEQIALREWLVGQLVAQEHAKLEQGGHTRNQIPLRRVFVDLPVCDTPLTDGDRDNRSTFLAKLLEATPLRLRTTTKLKTVIQGDGNLQYFFETVPGRMRQNKSRGSNLFSANLLIGGPGQGKSTLGQLASQIHRAALLAPVTEELSYPQRMLVASFDPQNSKNNSALWPLNPLLPIQVALPDLSTWLAKEGAIHDGNKTGPAILRFITELPSVKVAKLGISALQKILRFAPLLLIFDGFDEVGASEDRKRIVGAIRELILFLATVKASAQIIATTRPQGYAGELEHIGIPLTEHYLVPLHRREALEYATKLLEAKIGGADEREKMLGRLNEASKDSATARLLTTPLQVTILAALVQQIGRAPRERWNLFYRYFSYTYDREIERETYASPLLSTYRPQIEQIHARVALLLQVEAERDGGASARMPKEKLIEVITAVLSEDEFDENDRQRLTYEIAVAAGNRLVFLVEPEPNAFGFEIRSLQEFMAAWAITTGRDAEVEARIELIAAPSIFRNVMLFVASRFYSEVSSLRDVISENVCPALDEGNDESLRLTRAGALLALEILEEGAVLSQPKRARSLMGKAMSLLELPTSKIHARLAISISQDTATIFFDAIEERLSRAVDDYAKFSAWTCLIERINRNDEVAIRIGNRYWQQLSNLAELMNELRTANVLYGKWFLEKIEESSISINPKTLFGRRKFAENSADIFNWANWFTYIFSDRETFKDRGVLGCSYITEKDHILPVEPQYPPPKEWDPYVKFIRFEYIPNALNLANALESIAHNLSLEKWSNLHWNCSWPIRAALASAESAYELLNIASRTRKGLLGDVNEWRQSQLDWPNTYAKSVFSKDWDILPWENDRLKTTPPLLAIPAWMSIEQIGREPFAIYTTLLQMRQETRKNPLRRWLARTAIYVTHLMKSGEGPGVNEFQKLLADSPEDIDILIPKPRSIKTSVWLELLNENEKYLNVNFALGPEGVLNGSKKRTHFPHILLRLAVRSIDKNGTDYYSDEFEFEKMASLLRQLIPRNEKEKIYIAILELYTGTLDTNLDDWIIKAAIHHSDSQVNLLEQLVYAIHTRRVDVKRQISILHQAFSYSQNNYHLMKDIISLLRLCLNSLKTGLESPIVWTSLGFSFPLPAGNKYASQEKGIPDTPIWLRTIELINIGRFSSITFDFNEPEPERGQWIVILGQNGAGKSTLLRSIAIALRNVKDPSIWPSRAFNREWVRLANPGSEPIKEGRIKLVMDQGNVHITTIRHGTPQIFTQTPEQQGPRQIPIFAYGCRRGSALGGVNREVDLSDGMEIATLVDDNASLIHVETWLKDLDGDALKSEPSRIIFEVVVNAMCKLLDVKRVWVENKKVWVIENTGPAIGFAEMSDGYLTSAGWLVDLIARWITLAEMRSEPVGKNFMMNMTGIVLIDEIDLHLHPKWQIEIIKRTRELLPKMSFLATTHNPLTLVGAKANEIWILQEDGNEVRSSQGIGMPLLLTGGQIYQRYFGVRDIYPNELGRAMQRLSFLSGIDMHTEDERKEFEELQIKIIESGLPIEWADLVKNQDNNADTKQ